MKLIQILLSIICTVFSTAIMSYISMATPIGPWIGPTIALLIMCIPTVTYKQAALIVSCGSIGGILATACGFYLPTLYFLAPDIFAAWIANPLYFCCVISSMTFVSAYIGFLVADFFEDYFFSLEKMTFPIGVLINKILHARESVSHTYQLLSGGVVATAWSVLQYIGFIAPAYRLSIFSMPIAWNMTIMPMIIAIGYIAGQIMTIPLFVGIITKIGITFPLHIYFFSFLSHAECVLGLCGGLALSEVLLSIINLLLRARTFQYSKRSYDTYIKKNIMSFLKNCDLFLVSQICFALIYFFIFFSYMKLSFLAQLFLLIGAIISAYMIAFIAGKIGLALMGRFATFVMIPMIFLFDLTDVHITLICSCIGIAGGVAADVLFGRKIAQLSAISKSEIRKSQVLGIAVSSIAVGVIFLCLIRQFGLGTSELFAYRAQSRQLLLHAMQFNIVLVSVGVLLGVCFHYFNINSILVMGGILMPIDITIGLIFGGVLSHVSAQSQKGDFFWSGVFVANALLMMCKIFL